MDSKDSQVTQAVLNFVDLAGSEKLSSHEASSNIETSNTKSYDKARNHEVRVRERINEGKNINKSLFFLT